MMGTHSQPVDIEAMLRACGVSWVRTVDPLDFDDAIAAAKEASEQKEVSAIIFRSPCVAPLKAKTCFVIEDDRCISCKKCIREIGCPAISVKQGNRVEIEPSLCFGCGLCTYVCPADAIKEAAK